MYMPLSKLNYCTFYLGLEHSLPHVPECVGVDLKDSCGLIGSVWIDVFNDMYATFLTNWIQELRSLPEYS